MHAKTYSSSFEAPVEMARVREENFFSNAAAERSFVCVVSTKPSVKTIDTHEKQLAYASHSAARANGRKSPKSAYFQRNPFQWMSSG